MQERHYVLITLMMVGSRYVGFHIMNVPARNIFSTSIQILQNVDFDQNKDERSGENNASWRAYFWQSCTEFGFFQTTNQEEQTFGSSWPLEYSEKTCSDAYGADLSPKKLQQAVDQTNEEYQGFSPNVTNVVWVHGSLDPWHPLGITSDLNEASPAIFIPGASHGEDMQPSDPSDSREMRDAKKKIGELVSQWVTKSQSPWHF